MISSTLIQNLNNLIDNIFNKNYWQNYYTLKNIFNWDSLFELSLVIIAMLLLHTLFTLYKKHSKIAATKSQLSIALFHLLFPSIIFVISWLITAISFTYFAYFPIWVYLICIATPWVIATRLLFSILHYIFPNSFGANSKKTIKTIFCIIFILWITNLDHTFINLFKNTTIPIGQNSVSLFTIITGLIWSVIIIMLALWFANIIDTQIMQMNTLDENLRLILSKVIKIFCVFIAISIALPIIGVNPTAFTVFGGAFAAGLGFSLKNIVSNYISGFIILLDKSISLNDRITVENFTGYVSKITSRFVVLKSSNGVDALVPNETFISKTIRNESYSDKELLKEVKLLVAFNTDLNQAFEIILDSIKNHANISSQKATAAYVSNITTYGIEITLSYWIIDPQKGIATANSDILQKINTGFKKSGIEFTKLYINNDSRT